MMGRAKHLGLGLLALPVLPVLPVLVVLVGGACAREEGVPGPNALAPNVLVIVGDDISASDVPFIPTPNLDALVARGVAFDRAYSMPTCSPTRYTILFGKYRGFDSGNVCGEPTARTPDPSSFSLPRMMKAAGYATGAFGKWHVGTNKDGPWEETPQAHGFDVWRAGMPMNPGSCGGSDYWSWMRVDDGRAELSSEYCTLAVRDSLIEWWKRTEGPKLAYASFAAPHGPFHRPPDELLPDPPDRELVSDRSKYMAMLISLDTAVGEVLRAVDPRDTWVIFLGDNGCASQVVRPDQNPNKMKSTTFEEGIRVPMSIAGPGLKRASRSDALVHTVDLLATIAELVGISIPAGEDLDSVSFAPTLRDPAFSARTHVYSELRTSTHWKQAVVTRRYKLHRRTDLGDSGGSVLDGARIEKLHDLELDPREDLLLDLEDPEHREILAELREVMESSSRPAEGIF